MTNTYSPSPIHLPLVSSGRSLKIKRSRRQRAPKESARAAIGIAGAEWARLHLSLGVCATSAARWFQSAPALLRERYQLALAHQAAPAQMGDYPLLHDPIEDDPQWRDAFAEVEEMLAFELELDEVEAGPNFCFLLWNEKARLLREEFGLEWFNPAQMNPFVRFA